MVVKNKRTKSPIVEAAAADRLGARIRELRAGGGLTLEELAERSEVSRAMLSKVERGETNPTLVIAAKIASALEVSLTSLLGVEEERRSVVVVPRGARRSFTDPETGFERQLLSPPFEGRTVEFVRHVIPRGASSGNLPAYPRGVEKYLVVEQGAVEVTVDGEPFRLAEGDALYFEADVPHRFSNVGRSTCSYYLVVSSAGRGRSRQ